MESSKRVSSMENKPSGIMSATRAGSSSNQHSKPKPPLTNLSVDEAIALLKEDLTRPNALLQLRKMKASNPDMGPKVWSSSGTVFILLQEITKIYTHLSNGLTERMASQVCNVLSILQSVASNPQTRKNFIKAKLAEYMYPLITTTQQERSYEYLRVASLGVVGSLLKEDDAEALEYLLEGDIFSKCLFCLEMDNLIIKTVAAFILERLLTIGEEGLEHCCSSAEKLISLTRTLAQKINELGSQPPQRFLKHVINCYIKLAENPRACDFLEWHLPGKLADATFLQNDPTLISSVQTLIRKVSAGHRAKNIQPTGQPGLIFYK